MYGLDNQSGVNAMPALAPVKSPTPLWFTEGGSGLAPSYPGQDWFNMVQAEMLGVLSKGSIKPEKGKLNQLAEAISAIIASYSYSKTEINLKFQPAGNYAPAGDYATNAALENGLNKKLNTSSVTQSTGTSTTNVMSQKAVSDLVGGGVIGVGQAWQDVTESRSIETVYTNTTGRTIAVSVTMSPVSSGGGNIRLEVDGLVIMKQDTGSVSGLNSYPWYSVFGIVPAGSQYCVKSSTKISSWMELR